MKISERIHELASWAKQDLMRLIAQLEGHEADEAEPLADPADTAPGFEHVPDHVAEVAAVDTVAVPVMIDGVQAEGTGERAPEPDFDAIVDEVNGKKIPETKKEDDEA